MASAVRLADGCFSFDGGVDAGRTTTIESEKNPHGLMRNQLAWLTNGTVRGGGISPRDGWTQLTSVINAIGLYQSGYLYEPLAGNPYLIVQISGQIYQIRVDTNNSVVNLSAKFGNLVMPSQVVMGYMAQAEQFLIIQAGDYTQSNPTLPLFWDGVTLSRSKGITNTAVAPGTPNVNQIPGAGPMVYYQGRLWYCSLTTVSAGDIVRGPSGTAQYGFTDSIINVTENPLAVGGDGFAVPSQAGNITGVNYTSNQDATLGQGPLYIFTRRQVYQLTVPVTRADWIAANNSNQPQLTVVQIKYGAVGDRTITHVNGDLFYQTSEPAIRSLIIAVRYFSQWANVGISRSVARAMDFNKTSLMASAPGIEFDNRLWQGILPTQTPAGIAYQGIVALDFDVIDAFGIEHESQVATPPAWEGMYEGLDILQLFQGDFGSVNRAFALVHSRVNDQIYVWEMTDYLLADQDGKQQNRIQWYFETPAYDFGRLFDMKDLDGGELWVDAINGQVDMIVDYRPDADACWQYWTQFSFCSTATNPNPIPNAINNYPAVTLCEGQKFPLVLPKPPAPTGSAMNARPSNRGYQFQVRVRIKGSCQIRGLLLFALPVERGPYEGLNPASSPVLPTPVVPEPSFNPVSFLVGQGIPTNIPENPLFYLDNGIAGEYGLWSFDGTQYEQLIGSSFVSDLGFTESTSNLLIGACSPVGFVPSQPCLFLNNAVPATPNLWAWDGFVWTPLIGSGGPNFNGFTQGIGVPLVVQGAPTMLALNLKQPQLILDNAVPGATQLWSWDGHVYARLL